jgi:hypothetical protein
MQHNGSSVFEDKIRNIQNIGLDRIEKYLQLDDEEIAKKDPEITKHQYNQARLSMVFHAQQNINDRMAENNKIRIARLITDNKEELKGYLQESVKRFLPQE